MSKRFEQAYKQAPWRIQTQRVALLLIVVILGASILWVMLSVTVQAGAAGLDIQSYEYKQENLQRQIASLRTQYADLTSASRMLKRADEMGFQQTSPDSITYMVVPEYQGKETEIQVLPIQSNAYQPIIKPVYTESLWEWLQQGIIKMSEQPGGLSR